MIILVIGSEVPVLEDKRLIWDMKQGSSEALERLYEKYEGFLITVAVALCHRIDVAEDVVHDFFVSLVKSTDKLKVHGDLKAFMAICVANLARDRLRKSRRDPVCLADDIQIESSDASPEQRVIELEQAVALNRALSQLPFDQKEVVVLHLHAGMKFTQIARQRELSVNTIRSQYRYGISKLRSLLDNEVMS
jgi:RNA polymerase sigma-70 factor (ECF subfamily)